MNRLHAALAALPCALLLSQAGAQEMPPLDESALRALIERDVAGRGRVTLAVGQLDPRLKLAACRRAETFLPPGARLWGRSAIGVRCTDGANWSVSLPVTVSVWARVPVAAAQQAIGTPAERLSVREEEIDLTREAQPPLADLAGQAGRVLARPVAQGQPFRADHFRAATVFQPGDPVRVVLLGEGFSVTTDGQALAAAGEGQPLRVRLESGRIVGGTVRGRTLESRL